MGLKSQQQEFLDVMEKLRTTRMPFGKFGPKEYPPHGLYIYQLPYEYLAWFARKGFPDSTLGTLLAFVYQAKQDGAEAMFDVFRKVNENPRLRREKTVLLDLPDGIQKIAVGNRRDKNT